MKGSIAILQDKLYNAIKLGFMSGSAVVFATTRPFLFPS